MLVLRSSVSKFFKALKSIYKQCVTNTTKIGTKAHKNKTIVKHEKYNLFNCCSPYILTRYCNHNFPQRKKKHFELNQMCAN
uniref:Uncharacterized protein n=1 Tax=Rhizophora mucronata TaxID=61149 RepID=A0A2P2MD51_RHIMU